MTMKMVVAAAQMDEPQEELHYEVNFWESIKVYTIHSVYLSLARSHVCGLEIPLRYFFPRNSLSRITYTSCTNEERLKCEPSLLYLPNQNLT